GSFLFLENNVPLRAAGFANVNGLFEAHYELAGDIEVVRGPGSVLYGANAVHGLINFIAPSPSETAAGATVSGGSYGRVKGDVYASLLYGDQSVYAGFSALSENGFRAASGVDQQKFTLRHDYSGPALEVTTLLSGHNLNQETAGFVVGEDAYLDPELRRTNPNPEAFRDTQALRLSSRIAATLGNGDQLIVTPFARWNEMDFLLHFLPSQALEKNGHWSVGAQTLYRAERGPLSVIAGLDLDYTEGRLSEFQSIPTIFSFTQGAHYNYDVGSIALAPYLHGEYQLTERLKLTGGLRLDWTRYNYDTNIPAGDVGRFRRPEDRTDSFVKPIAKAGVGYQASDMLSLYLAYARGARPPQTTDLYRLQTNQTVGEIEPESIDNIEGGMRGQFGPLSYDVAGYFMDKSNFFFRDADGFNVPNGRTRHIGGEADIRVQLAPWAAFEGGVAYGRHTYRFDRPVGRATESISFGDDVDTSPRWLANSRVSVTPLPSVVAELEWVYVARYFTDAANDNSYPGHSVFNLRASWQALETVRVFGAVRNVTDTFYAERADFAFGNERFFPGEERAFTAGLDVAI
ncbi:MAG: TonB-dependent receptor, partial [Pseudomonadota bacterium]